MSRTPSLVRDTAHGFLARHIGEHLPHDHRRLIERCACHLLSLWPEIGHKSAVLTSVQMLGEVESTPTAAYVDVSHSTSYAVLVVDPIGHRVVAYTAAELLALAAGAPQLDLSCPH